MQTKTKKFFRELKRIDTHKDYLWKRIYDLRGEITDYVLVNTIDNKENKPVTHWKALKVKANSIRKYSQKLRKFDTVRWNEDVPERI